MSSSRPPVDLLFPGILTTMTAEFWGDLTFKTINHQKDPCYVTKVEYCKCREDKQHEFLLITLMHCPSETTTRILADRIPQIPPPNNHDTSSRPSQISSSLVTAMDQVRVNGPNGDEVTNGYSPFELLATLTFTHNPTLLDLSTLLIVVHQHSPVYNPMHYQCYWFANTVWGCLDDPRHGAHLEEGVNWSKRGTYLHIPVGKDSLGEVRKEHSLALKAAKRELQSRRAREEARENTCREDAEARGRAQMIPQLEAQQKQVEAERKAKEAAVKQVQKLEAEIARISMLAGIATSSNLSLPPDTQ